MTILGMFIMLGFQFKDIHTYANVDQVQTSHLSLDLKLDFDKKVIDGTCTATLVYADKKATHVDLDTEGLTIKSITTADGKALKYDKKREQDWMGDRLRIHFDGNQPEKIVIKYLTSPGAEAVQWLSPEQTTSKKMPFLFTQSQSIFARTWIPCMDTPGVRVTYDATVRKRYNPVGDL